MAQLPMFLWLEPDSLSEWGSNQKSYLIAHAGPPRGGLVDVKAVSIPAETLNSPQRLGKIVASIENGMKGEM